MKTEHTFDKSQPIAQNTMAALRLIDATEYSQKERIKEMIIEREHLGFKKYQKTMDRKDYTQKDWLIHLLEEILDGIQYAVAAQEFTLVEYFIEDANYLIKKIEGI